MKRKMNFKRNVLMILLVATIPAQAGWFDGFGDRIKRGIVNTIQNNISGRANKAADEATNAVIDAPTKVGDKQKQEETSSQEIEVNHLGTQSVASNKNAYEVIDLGLNLKMKAKRIKRGLLRPGESYKEVKVKLRNGRYLVALFPHGWKQTVSVEPKKNWGENIKFEKYIDNYGLKNMTAEKGPTIFIVKVETEGELQFGIGNNLDGDGQMEYEVLKLAPGELK